MGMTKGENKEVRRWLTGRGRKPIRVEEEVLNIINNKEDLKRSSEGI